MGLMSFKSNVGMACEDIPPKASMARRSLDWPIVVLYCEHRMDINVLILYCLHIRFDVTEA